MSGGLNNNKRLRWVVVILSFALVVETALIAVLGWRSVTDFMAERSMTDLSLLLFGRPSSASPGVEERSPIVARDTGGDIREIHDRIARLFDDLMSGHGGAGFPVAASTGGVYGMPDDFFRLQREIDRIFEHAFNDGIWRRTRHPLDWRWEQAVVSPGLRLREEQDAYEVVVALADVDRLGIEVHLQGRILSIMTRGHGRGYVTRLRLPGAVDGDNMQANYENNLLRIRVPKGGETETEREKLAVHREII